MYPACQEWPIPPGCWCSSPKAQLTISCVSSGLTSPPKLEKSTTLISLLDLSQNDINSIHEGDFFGVWLKELVLRNNRLYYLPILSLWGLEYYLEKLVLADNYFHAVPSGSLRYLRNLRILDLSSNRISTLHNYDFADLNNLKSLFLNKNPITKIEPQAFATTKLVLLHLEKLSLNEPSLEGLPTGNLTSLVELSFASNHVFDLPNGWSDPLQSLATLRLSRNFLSSLNPRALWAICPTLTVLDVSSNNFTSVPSADLRHLLYLRVLNLSDNYITSLEVNAFNCSRELQVLDLSLNLLHTLSIGCFEGLPSIQSIDLRGNELRAVEEGVIPWVSGDRQIYLSQNPWLCNCFLEWIKRGYRLDSPTVKMIADLPEMLCHTPHDLNGFRVTRVALRDFTCDHEYYFYEIVGSYDDSESDDQYVYYP